MSDDKTNLFPGLKDGKVSSRLPKLRPGRYTVEVTNAIWKRVRTPPSDAFILEFRVVKAEGEGANAVGSMASWYQSCADVGIGWGALKGFAAAIGGDNPEDPAFIEQVEPFMNAVVKDQILNGKKIYVETLITKTKPKTGLPEGGDFTRYIWGKMEGV